MTRARRLVDRRQVEYMVGMSRSSLYEAMAQRGFPRPIRIGPRSVRWFEDEVLAWMESRERGGPPLDAEPKPPDTD